MNTLEGYPDMAEVSLLHLHLAMLAFISGADPGGLMRNVQALLIDT